MKVFSVDKIYKTKVVNRPSKSIKSPYLADIIDPKDKTSIVLCHTPSLGACGLIVPDAEVYVQEKNTKAKSKYSLDFLIYKEKRNKVTICVNPSYANSIILNMLKKNLIVQVDNIIPEFSIMNNRLDFKCTKGNTDIYIEVKSVILADYEDVSTKEKKKLDTSIYDFNKKIAIFPDGYRKSQEDVISPRALAQVELLTKLAKKNNTKSYLIFVCQRSDINSFTVTKLDPIYRKAVIKAINSGVNVIAYKISWKKNIAYFTKELDIILD